MKIKSILLEIEDEELGCRKVLLSEFINQKQDKIEMTISQNNEYPYSIINVLKSNIKINIGLECSKYKVTDTSDLEKGEK